MEMNRRTETPDRERDQQMTPTTLTECPKCKTELTGGCPTCDGQEFCPTCKTCYAYKGVFDLRVFQPAGKD
jgi:hypothetical protein